MKGVDDGVDTRLQVLRHHVHSLVGQCHGAIDGLVEGLCQLGKSRLEQRIDQSFQKLSIRRDSLLDERRGGIDQLLGEVNPPGLGHRERRRSQVSAEQAAQVPIADTQTRGELLDATAVEGALGDQTQRAGDRRRGPQPGGGARRSLGTAAKAGPKPGLLSGRGAGKKQAIRPFRGQRRADRPAVDPG